VWAPGPVPTGATGVMAPFTHGKGNQHQHRVIEANAGRQPLQRTPMCVPMMRVERPRGHRIVAVAPSILVIAHALSTRAGPITTSVTTTSPTEQTSSGSRAASSLTLDGSASV
jgi:hypothetical protein